jgi:two-component system, cell cycle sensor histidine kinase and response regulator CckA
MKKKIKRICAQNPVYSFGLKNPRSRRWKRRSLIRKGLSDSEIFFENTDDAVGLTERRQTERALRESKNKFRDLSEKSVVGVYLIQGELFKYVNPKLAEIFGYTTDELIDKKGPGDVVWPQDWPLVNGNIKRRLNGEIESIHYEFRGITSNQEIRYIEVHGSRTRYNGRPAVIGTLLDVTERKRAEELLKDAEQKYRSIFENAVEGIFQSTPAGKLLAANPAFAKMLGYDSPEECLSFVTDIGCQLYSNPIIREEFAQKVEEDGLLRGFECELCKKNGDRIWVAMNAHAVRDKDNRVLYYEGTLEDITEDKEVEHELNRLHQLNKAIIENSPVAIFTIDMNGKLMSVNPALANLSGLGLEVEEKLLGFNWLQNPYTVRCGLSEYIRKGLEGEPFQLWDFAFMTYRGDRNIFMDFNGVPLKGKDGNIEGLLCIIEETTERVMTRAKLMQEVKMSAIGRLAAGIAHELNNPLGTLVAYAERASNYLESINKDHPKQFALEKLRDYLNIIDEEAFRCKRVVSDILSIPKKEGMEIIQVDIEDFLDRILEHMNIDNTHLTITREAKAPLPRILGDSRVLRQVFVNLINNAVDALEGRMDAKLWIRTALENKMVIIEVEDNGIGIPDAIIDKIFEPLFTTKESKKGIGLGLSLCHDFIGSMGGTIKVESKPGFGTTFAVSLPINMERKQAEEGMR